VTTFQKLGLWFVVGPRFSASGPNLETVLAFYYRHA